MSKRNIDKQVYEQYVDATVALFMEHYTAALTDAVLAEESDPATGSESMDRRCMEMIRKECAKQRRKEVWKGTKKILQSAAVIVVALLSLSSILFMTVEAFRVPVINFFIEQGDGFWAITGRNSDDPIDPATSDEFDPNDPLAGLLPEGYEIDVIRENSEQGRRIHYKNSSGNKLQFWWRPNISDMTINSEYATFSKECRVAACDGAFVLRDGMAQLLWISKDDCISYMLSSDTLDEKSLLGIAEQYMKIIAK